MNSKIENLQDTITDKDDYIEELEKINNKSNQ